MGLCGNHDTRRDGPRPATDFLRGGVRQKVASDHMASGSVIGKSLGWIWQTMKECTPIDWQVSTTWGSSVARPYCDNKDISPVALTFAISGSEKRGDEAAPLFTVRVDGAVRPLLDICHL